MSNITSPLTTEKTMRRLSGNKRTIETYNCTKCISVVARVICMWLTVSFGSNPKNERFKILFNKKEYLRRKKVMVTGDFFDFPMMLTSAGNVKR